MSEVKGQRPKQFHSYLVPSRATFATVCLAMEVAIIAVLQCLVLQY